MSHSWARGWIYQPSPLLPFRGPGDPIISFMRNYHSAMPNIIICSIFISRSIDSHRKLPLIIVMITYQKSPCCNWWYSVVHRYFQPVAIEYTLWNKLYWTLKDQFISSSSLLWTFRVYYTVPFCERQYLFIFLFHICELLWYYN